MKSLRVGIVGAGIGGLQAGLALAHDGHHITIFETAKEFLEVGAGIRVPPNSSRLSLAWGVDLDSVKKVVSRGNRFVDWKGNRLLDCPFDNAEEKYGAPYYFLHRADLINALVEAARKRSNIALLMDTKVIDYDFDGPAVQTVDRAWHNFDLIICADGIKSSVRNAVNGTDIEATDTGDVAYRILVPIDALLADPETSHLVTDPWATHWIGPEAHAVGYPLRGGELYNIIIDVTHATDRGQPIGLDEWRSETENSHLIERFQEWCPPVRKMCELTGRYLKWKLADFDQLKRWIHPSGKVVLLGDSCHPMMPYMAQGAAQATEDAATLASAILASNDLSHALRLYERQRLPRAAYIARHTRVLQQWWHLYDGPERNHRDRLMKVDGSENPIFWGCSERRDWLFQHDARILMQESEETKIPKMPSLPNPKARVYSTAQ